MLLFKNYTTAIPLSGGEMERVYLGSDWGYRLTKSERKRWESKHGLDTPTGIQFEELSDQDGWLTVGGKAYWVEFERHVVSMDLDDTPCEVCGASEGSGFANLVELKRVVDPLNQILSLKDKLVTERLLPALKSFTDSEVLCYDCD